MKCIAFLLVCFLLSVGSVFGQSSRRALDSVAALLERGFKAGDAGGLYELTSSAMRSKMTAEQFFTAMVRFGEKAGSWKRFSFAASTAKGADYLVEFEGGKQILSLDLDVKGKIDRMNFAVATAANIPKTYQAKSNNPLRDSVDQMMEKLVRPYIQKGNTSGIVVAVVTGGKTRYYSYGEVKRGGGVLPDASKTIFEIGSVSKTLTSLLLAQQVTSGRVKLDDPVNMYLPDSLLKLEINGSPITLKHLATHTSGLPRLPANIFLGAVDAKDPYRHYGVDSLFSFLKGYRLTQAPGKTYAYSNLGVGLLGVILERLEGKSYEQLIVWRITRPLGMNSTRVELTAELQKNFATAYNEKGEQTPGWDLAALKGSGAIRSTLADMTRYLQAQMSGKSSLSKEITLSQQVAFAGQPQSMGLGWQIISNGRRTFHHHSGGTGGFRSFVGFDLKGQHGIVILSNAAEDVTSIGQAFLMQVSR